MSVKYINIVLTGDDYERLDFYARHVHNKFGAKEMAQGIVSDWIALNTDPAVVKSGIERLVDRLLGVCTCKPKPTEQKPAPTTGEDIIGVLKETKDYILATPQQQDTEFWKEGIIKKIDLTIKRVNGGVS